MTSDLQPADGETLDRLSASRRVLQRRGGHRSGTDDVLAAWCAWQAMPDAARVADLGCGHATVALLLSSVLVEAEFVGVEAQELSAALGRRNLALNGLEDRALVHHADLRDFEDAAGFDLVTGTPPFLPLGSGLLPKDPQRAAARFELRGGIEAYADAAVRLLRPGGRVSLLMDAQQDARCRGAVEAAGLHLRRLLIVEPVRHKELRFRGYVASLEAHDEPIVEERMTVRDAAGRFTPAMVAVRRRFELG
jgi:tRNA1Val (adenine37-N6)-methyltransferase